MKLTVDAPDVRVSIVTLDFSNTKDSSTTRANELRQSQRFSEQNLLILDQRLFLERCESRKLLSMKSDNETTNFFVFRSVSKGQRSCLLEVTA